MILLSILNPNTRRTTSGRCSDTPIGGKLAPESLKLNGPLWPSTKESAPEIWVEFRNGISLRERLVCEPPVHPRLPPTK